MPRITRPNPVAVSRRPAPILALHPTSTRTLAQRQHDIAFRLAYAVAGEAQHDPETCGLCREPVESASATFSDGCPLHEFCAVLVDLQRGAGGAR